MTIPFKSILFSSLLYGSFAVAQEAEFIWAEEDQNGSRIYLSQHENGAWQAAEKVVDDNKLNILPALGSDSKGQRLAVWSTVDGIHSVLKYSTKQGNSWGKPSVLPSQLSTNLAAVVAFDDNDVCWVFWSANDGGDDDIYVSKFIKGAWSEPEMVNEDNDVPDILPEAGQDENGNIWVSWQQLQEQGYSELTRSFETAKLKKMSAENSITVKKIEEFRSDASLSRSVQPPNFHRSLGRASMHYPKNKKRPSTPVKGSLTP